MAAEVQTAEKFARRPPSGLQAAMASVGAVAHSAPVKCVLTLSDPAEDVAPSSFHVVERSVHAVVYGREAFSAELDQQRPPFRLCSARAWSHHRASGRVAADVLDASGVVVVTHGRHSAPRTSHIRRAVCGSNCQKVRWTPWKMRWVKLSVKMSEHFGMCR